MQDENTLGYASGGTGDMPMIGKAPSAQGGLAPGKAASTAKTPGRKAFGNITNLKGRKPRMSSSDASAVMHVSMGLPDSSGCAVRQLWMALKCSRTSRGTGIRRHRTIDPCWKDAGSC